MTRNAGCNEILSELLITKLKTICFAQTRNQVEVIHSILKKNCSQDKHRIDSYRGGYLPSERRTIEQRLFNGDTDVVISTNALELGIDIGALDSCVLVGYPGSIASLWQQAGRSGRSGHEALIIFIAGDKPVDQYFVRNPEALFGKSPENAIVNPFNILILSQHLQCALYELPITLEDQQYFGDKIFSILSVFVKAKRAIEKYEEDTSSNAVREWILYDNKSYPAARINIRSIDNSYDILDKNKGKIIGTIDESGAYAMLHLDAIYLHQSRTYRSVDLDIVRKVAEVENVKVDYYTVAMRSVNIPEMDDISEEKKWRITLICFGDVKVIKHYDSFKKIKFYPKQVLAYGDIDLPPLTLKTEAIKLEIPEELTKETALYGNEFFNSGLIGIAQLFLSMMTLHVMCDSKDIDAWVDFQSKTIYIYDQIEAGAGFAERAFDLIEIIMNSAFQLLMECPCSLGCPACVIYQGNNKEMECNYEFPKEATKFIIYALLEKGPYKPKIKTAPSFYKREKPFLHNQKLSVRELKKVRKALHYFYRINDKVETILGPGTIIEISGEKCLIQLENQVACIWENFSDLL